MSDWVSKLINDGSFRRPCCHCTVADNQRQRNRTLHTPRTQRTNIKSLPWLTCNKSYCFRSILIITQLFSIVTLWSWTTCWPLSPSIPCTSWNLTTQCLAVTGSGSDGECGRLSHPRWLFVCTIMYTVSKNDTDVAHCNCNTHQPILVTFGRDVVERVCYQMVICYPTSPN